MTVGASIPTLAASPAAVEPGPWGLAASGVLVLLTVVVSLWRGLGLERAVVWASLRALVQLMIVGAALHLVIDDTRPLWPAVLWLVVMVVFAARTIRGRAPEVPGIAAIAAVAFGLALLVSLGVLFGLGVFEPTGRSIVPLSGMVIGNSLASTALVARRIVEGFTERREEIEARLALGRSPADAARPYLREAVRTALIPQIETTRSVGIVFLPGAMVGLILAGADPAAAVRVQLAVMYLILGSVTTTTTVVALALSRRLFTADERVVRLDRRAD